MIIIYESLKKKIIFKWNYQVSAHGAENYLVFSNFKQNLKKKKKKQQQQQQLPKFSTCGAVVQREREKCCLIPQNDKERKEWQ